MAGTAKSGVPVARETVEAALAAVESGMSLRAAAERFEVCRDTLSRYRDGALFRRKFARCDECGAVVAMPCLACSAAVKVAAAKRERRLRARASRV